MRSFCASQNSPSKNSIRSYALHALLVTIPYVIVNILVLDREQRGANGDFDENGEQSPNS